MGICINYRLGAIVTVLVLLQGSFSVGFAEETANAGWFDTVRTATVALGKIEKLKVFNPDGTNVLNPDGTPVEKEIFAVVGTGVLTGLPDDPSGTPYLVTAKHVLFDPGKNWDPSNMQLRFSWFDSKTVAEYFGVTIPLKEGDKHLWTAHPDPGVDLAAIPLKILAKDVGRDSVKIVPLKNFATEEDLYEGASVLVLGYPGAVGPAFWSRVLARSGIIAWVHPTEPAKEPLLIDAMVLPGNSGGPVFKLPTGLGRRGEFALGGKIKLLGVVTAARLQSVPLVAGGKSVEIPGPKGPVKVVSEDYVGIGIVEPVSRVLTVINAARSAEK